MKIHIGYFVKHESSKNVSIKLLLHIGRCLLKLADNSSLKHFLNVTVPKAFFFQWRRSAMLDFLNPENMKGTTFRFLFHAFDW